ncbi:MAG TPA: hypothetical protein VGY55_15325 [Pirellulales bacterium]|jgi:uncharacterized paraquat-inducible protein A|nr:hypothetical protein [Pirellulales bacterium]
MDFLTCPDCGKVVSNPNLAAGTHVHCRGCGQIFTVPAALALPSPDEFLAMLDDKTAPQPAIAREKRS